MVYWFVYKRTRTHGEKERRGNGNDTISFLSPPSHSEMFLSLPWEQGCKTSALVTSKGKNRGEHEEKP